ncbi:hypothetical protein D3C86_1382760 [compost metagenome]
MAAPSNAAEIGENMANNTITVMTAPDRSGFCFQIRNAVSAWSANINGNVLSTLNLAEEIQKPGIDTMNTTDNRISSP